MTTENKPSEFVAPKIFISYSWTSPEYADWVLKFAEKLVNPGGIDVVIDVWDLQAGQDKFVFMEQMVNDPEISKVLILCDKRYKERAEGREGGVGAETTIMSSKIYANAKQEKFIPVITERRFSKENPTGEIYIPTFVDSRIFIDLSRPETFETDFAKLWRTLTGRPEAVKPTLSQPAAYLLETNRPTSPTTFALRAFETAIMSDKRSSTGLARDYMDRLYEELRKLQIDVKEVTNREERDCLMLRRLDDWDPLREEWVSFLRLLSRYSMDSRSFEVLPGFFESLLKLTRPLGQPEWNQHLSFIVHEAFLYAVSVLLQEARFEVVAELLSAHYRDAERTEFSQRYGIFWHGSTEYLCNLLNRQWSEGGKTKYQYPQQNWIFSRAKNDLISFDLLKEADVILWLRWRLENASQNQFVFLSWYPITTGSLEDYQWRVQNFPVFQRAASRRFFDQFKSVLGVASKDDLLKQWELAMPQESSRYDEYWKRIFNINEIAST